MSIKARLKKLEDRPGNRPGPELTLVLKYKTEEERQAAEDRDARYPLRSFHVVHILGEVMQ